MKTENEIKRFTDVMDALIYFDIKDFNTFDRFDFDKKINDRTLMNHELYHKHSSVIEEILNLDSIDDRSEYLANGNKFSSNKEYTDYFYKSFNKVNKDLDFKYPNYLIDEYIMPTINNSAHNMKNYVEKKEMFDENKILELAKSEASDHFTLMEIEELHDNQHTIFSSEDYLKEKEAALANAQTNDYLSMMGMDDNESVKEELGLQPYQKQELGLQPYKKQELGLQPYKKQELGLQPYQKQELGLQPVDMEDEVIEPIVIKNDPAITKKTWMAIAAGVAAGASIKFIATTNPQYGTIITAGFMAVMGYVSGRLKEQRNALKIERLNNPAMVTKIEVKTEENMNFFDKVKNKVKKLNDYITSEEGLRDVSYAVNTSIATVAALNIFDLAKGVVTATPDAVVTTTPEVLTPEPILPETVSLDSLEIGGSLEGMNLDTGHISASYAHNDLNSVNLLSDVVNPANSTIGEFAVMGDSGEIIARVSEAGLDPVELANQYNVSIDNIVANITDNSGNAQAWQSVTDLVGKSRGM